MKVGFVVPILAEYDVQKCYANIKKACAECKIDFDLIFAFSEKLTSLFSHVRNTFMECPEVKAFKVDQNVNKHMLITLALANCEKYNATIIYSGKDEVNIDVVKAFIASYRAGNKIVYLKKIPYGPRILGIIKEALYKFGLKIIGSFKDYYAETDIQLLDQDVVKTINKLPAKNRKLRTLDSFIGYNSDIIHMEVDSKQKVSKHYDESTKEYKAYLSASIVCGVLCLADIVMTIVTVACRWNIGVVWLVLMMIGVLLLFGGWLVTLTKRILVHRVGRDQSLSELKALEQKMEKYNY